MTNEEREPRPHDTRNETMEQAERILESRQNFLPQIVITGAGTFTPPPPPSQEPECNE